MSESSLEEGEIDFQQVVDRVQKRRQTTKEAFKAIPRHPQQKHPKPNQRKNMLPQTISQPQVTTETESIAPKGPVCSICKVKGSKYKCPGCDRRTCSSICCNKHKQRMRNDTKMIKIDEYGSVHAIRDYNFLSTVIRDTEVVHKRLIGSTALPDALRYKLLKVHARRLLQIDLRLAPKIMQRHRDNISFYSVRDKVLYWCLEVRVFLSATVIHTHLIDPQSSNEKVADILRKEDLFSTDVLTHHGINLGPESLIKSLEDRTMKAYYPYQEVLNFLEQEEYKFTNTKNKRRQQFNPYQTATPQLSSPVKDKEIDIERQLGEVIHSSTVHEYPTIWLVPDRLVKEFESRSF